MCAITFAKPPKHHHAIRNQTAAHTLTIVLLLLARNTTFQNSNSTHTITFNHSVRNISVEHNAFTIELHTTNHSGFVGSR